MAKILITGVTGFLGRNLSKTLHSKGHVIVGTAHSESGVKSFEISHDFLEEMYVLDIADSYHSLIRILRKHKVDYVIHAAALKHVGICEKNPTRAINVNVLGSSQIIRASLECGVKNVIGVSTDKSINPTCVYGMTKKMMEEMLLENGYGVFQGVNFLFSTGSVLDIWEKKIDDNLQISVNSRAIRYFSKIDDICHKISDSLDNTSRFSVDKCYRINIGDLQKAFSKYHDYWNVGEYKPLSVEKIDEDLPRFDIDVQNASEDIIYSLLEEHYKNTQVLR